MISPSALLTSSFVNCPAAPGTTGIALSPVSLLIKIDSIGPILYLQSRSGKAGELFNIIKFRSMVCNAESDTGPVWAGKEDRRITRFGRLLRRFHIDETPQLINILKGDMSIIGPRPERPFFVEKLKETYPFYNRRLKIRPGVSGWAQINQPFDTYTTIVIYTNFAIIV